MWFELQYLSMILAEKIFRAYDIRGESFVDFDEDGFFAIAHAFAMYLKEKFDEKNPQIFLSGDGRTSMPQLWPAVAAGLEAGGAIVTWGGAIPTPINYFAIHEGDFDAGVQISASHNPAKDNGLKLTDRHGAVCGDEIQKIKDLAFCNECKAKPDSGFGQCVDNCEKVDFFAPYLKKVLDISNVPSGAKKIVVDAGNGISGMFYPQVLRELGYQIEELYCDLDGSFPNHQPDPERPENLKCLIKKVAETSADFGLAFDGDGDRVGIVLRDGSIVSADQILYGLSVDFLSRNPKAKIVLDAMCSDTLVEKIREKNGNPILSKTGHSHIEQKMHVENAKLGGEQSGHFMLGENFYGHDDACLAAIRFLHALEEHEDLLKDIKNWPELYEFSEKLAAPDEEKFEILEKFSAEILKSYPAASTIDGIRISYGAGEWAIVRCSNTSPKIAVRIEANTKESLEKKKNFLVQKLETYL